MCAKVKKQVFKGRPLPLNQFHSKVPDVLLAYIFSFLAPKDLHNVGLVCKWWKILLSDESIWRDAFERVFKFIPPMRLSSSWRLEYLSRVESVRNLEFSRLHVTDVDSRLTHIDQISFYSRFNSDNSNYLAAGHLETGTCSLLEIDRGKFDKYVLFDSARRQPTCLELTREGALVGFLSGQVALSQYSDSNVTFFPSGQSHTDSITALALSEENCYNDSFLVASGSIDGLLCVWDTSGPKLFKKLDGLKSAALKIILNNSYVLVLDTNSSLFLWKLVSDLEPSPISCGIKVKDVNFVTTGSSVLVLYESGGLEQLNLNTLERINLLSDTITNCYSLNSAYPRFGAFGGAESVSLIDFEKGDRRKFQPQLSLGSPVTAPHSLYFDNIKLIGFFGDVARIWCVSSRRQIRKIAFRNYIPRRLIVPPTDPFLIASASKNRLVVAVGKSVILIGVGNESAHLVSKPKRAWKHKIKAHGSTHLVVKETLKDLEEEETLNARDLFKLQKLQDLSGLTEEEVMQYALSLSKGSDSHAPTLENHVLDSFGALNLTEEEALDYAIFLSQESQK